MRERRDARGTPVAGRYAHIRHLNGGKETEHKLETIAIILIVLWLLGLVSGYVVGNFIHILLVIAVVLILVRLINGRRV